LYIVVGTYCNNRQNIYFNNIFNQYKSVLLSKSGVFSFGTGYTTWKVIQYDLSIENTIPLKIKSYK